MRRGSTGGNDRIIYLSIVGVLYVNAVGVGAQSRRIYSDGINVHIGAVIESEMHFWTVFNSQSLNSYVITHEESYRLQIKINN